MGCCWEGCWRRARGREPILVWLPAVAIAGAAAAGLHGTRPLHNVTEQPVDAAYNGVMRKACRYTPSVTTVGFPESAVTWGQGHAHWRVSRSAGAYRHIPVAPGCGLPTGPTDGSHVNSDPCACTLANCSSPMIACCSSASCSVSAAAAAAPPASFEPGTTAPDVAGKPTESPRGPCAPTPGVMRSPGAAPAPPTPPLEASRPPRAGGTVSVTLPSSTSSHMSSSSYCCVTRAGAVGRAAGTRGAGAWCPAAAPGTAPAPMRVTLAAGWLFCAKNSSCVRQYIHHERQKGRGKGARDGRAAPAQRLSAAAALSAHLEPEQVFFRVGLQFRLPYVAIHVHGSQERDAGPGRTFPPPNWEAFCATWSCTGVAGGNYTLD